MTRWLTTELRTSPARWPLAALLVWGVAALVDPDAQWVGWWQDTGLKVHIFTALVLGPVAGGLAAWQAGRSQPVGLASLENTSTVPGSWVGARVATSVWCLATAAMLVVGFAAFVRTGTVRWGPPPWGVLLLTLSLLAAQVAFGVALGSWLPRWVATILATTMLYAAAAPPFYFDAEHTWGRLYPTIQQSWGPNGVEDLGRLALVSAWLVTLTLLLLTLAGMRRPLLPPPRTWLVGCVIVTVGTACLVLMSPAQRGAQFFNPRGPADPVTCAGLPTARICVWQEEAQLLPPLLDAFTHLHQAGLGLHFLPDVLYLNGMPAPEGQRAEAVVVTSAVPSDQQARLIVTGAALPPIPAACFKDDGTLRFDVTGRRLVEALVSHRLGLDVPTGEDEHALTRLLAQPLPDQDAWANDAVAAANRCQTPPPPERS